MCGPLYPGDEKEVLGIDYIMNDELFMRRDELYSIPITARAFVEGKLVSQERNTVKSVQNY
jgi:hypothetical protein